MRKSVGIITMHKVINFGSALQAYALQQVVRGLGYDVELIDYKFPPQKKVGVITKIKRYFGNFFNLTSGFRKLNLFDSFWRDFFVLSKSYDSEESIRKNPPVYDIYLTGSDQVWNTKYTKDDCSFLLAFSESENKVSYASSFSTKKIDEKYIHNYKRYLNEYKYLSSREISGVGLLKDLTLRDAHLVLDPTLLLDSKEWNSIADSVEDKYKGRKYILLYVMKYSFDPTCMILKFASEIQSRLGIKVISLSEMPSFDGLDMDIEVGIGPIQFLQIVRNASYMITASFHGTAFAINYNIPFSSVIVDSDFEDDRQYSLLQVLSATNRSISMNSFDFSGVDLNMSFVEINKNLELMREVSLDYLRNSLL